ncbi:14646_t:CDS:10 [Acaulospora colombiana]|uniref:14646_t:CDS:1 n=1 Tax=Acaulospora colombiana TaxID=27376 RepID=A0ACA9K5X2_9GLOM|nr:14646_t:CDS:10 [Acaulospora colombiana]
MNDDEALSGSFFEPVVFQAHSDIPDTPIVGESLSFMTDSLDMNLNIGGNPWDPPSASGVDVANILSDVSLPEIYTTAFTLASPVVGRVSISALNKILSVSGLPHATIEKILNLAAPASSNSTRVNRGEFNVALALSINFNRSLSFSTISHPPPITALQADDPWAAPSANGEYTNSAFTEGPVPGFPPSTGIVAPPITSGALPREDEFQWFLDTDVITVKFAPEREGFLFKHVNYIVESQDDELVEIFLKESTEIAVWRKNNTPDLEEEYLKKQITPEMEQRIPANLDERLEKVIKKLDDGIDHYRNMCNLMERIARRQEGMATDYMRYSLAMNSMIEKEKGCYVADCYNCNQVINGLEQVSSHFQKTSSILEDMLTTLETVLENLKRHRDLLVSFRETFERRDRLAVDMTESLNSRIAANQAKLTPLTGKEGTDPEVERLSTAIKKVQSSVSDLDSYEFGKVEAVLDILLSQPLSEIAAGLGPIERARLYTLYAYCCNSLSSLYLEVNGEPEPKELNFQTVRNLDQTDYLVLMPYAML